LGDAVMAKRALRAPKHRHDYRILCCVGAPRRMRCKTHVAPTRGAEYAPGTGGQLAASRKVLRSKERIQRQKGSKQNAGPSADQHDRKAESERTAQGWPTLRAGTFVRTHDAIPLA
jgi:hypothetical protein